MPKSSRKESKKKRKQRDSEEDTKQKGETESGGATDSIENNKEQTKEEDPPENDVNNNNKDDDDAEEEDGIITTTPFSSFSLHPSLLTSISSLKWEFATRIQRNSIPAALQGRDVIGLAETGSGKTGAFAIPILNYLLQKPQKAVFAVILAPTRELAFQIHEVVVALGRGMGANAVCVVGGVDGAS
mmetsp:Transcript_13596/g.29177  ORF Transcript_13596/g.29177 Transcript_13596/m.29177 type:complete len:186 (+) Transcript_13596:181-738(+)